MSDRQVVVTGMGAISAAGAGVPALWNALRQGHSRLQPLHIIDVGRHRSSQAGQVPCALVSQQARPAERAWQMLAHSINEAIHAAKLEQPVYDPQRIALVLGGTVAITEYSRHSLSTIASKAQDIELTLLDWARPELCAAIHMLDIRGPVAYISTACSASLAAIGYGADLIRWGMADMAVVGGAEALSKIDYVQFLLLKILAKDCMRPFDRTRNGMLLGEGSGVMVLEEEQHARARGAQMLARCAGYAVTACPGRTAVPEAEGLALCIRLALARSSVQAHDIDYICAHGTATAMSDMIETKAIKQALGEYARAIPISAVKPIIGHLSHASGIVEAIGVVAAMQDGCVPPTINYEHPDPACDLDYVPNHGRAQPIDVALKIAFGFGNSNCTVVFTNAP